MTRHRIVYFPRTRWPDVDLWFGDYVNYVNSIKAERAIALTENIISQTDIIFRIGPIHTHKIIRDRLKAVKDQLEKSFRIR